MVRTERNTTVSLLVCYLKVSINDSHISSLTARRKVRALQIPPYCFDSVVRLPPELGIVVSCPLLWHDDKVPSMKTEFKKSTSVVCKTHSNFLVLRLIKAHE